ncbi:MAG TPA: hypothetical protein VN721_05625 [Flavipsychrobacter sp.]|nr:hypothetical protein [Flavipsychrobacter sp.]
MKNFITILFLASTIGSVSTAGAKSTNYLNKCSGKQVKPLHGQRINFSYTEDQNNLYHASQPWQTINEKSKGAICCNEIGFTQIDTVSDNGKDYVTKVQLDKTALLIQNYWSSKIGNVSKSKFAVQPIEIARYSPIMLINYFREQKASPSDKSNRQYAVYTLNIDKKVVSLYIRKSDYLLDRVTSTENNDMWGDVTDTLVYTDYVAYQGVSYAKDIHIQKIHGIQDEVTMSANGIVKEMPTLLEKPKDYTIKEDENTPETVSSEKMADHVYCINLPQAESKVGLVEFKDFLVVIDVPLSSDNGELVIQEAKKIAPGKPIKYYTFSHHHPWALGGVRRFIYDGATILTRPEDTSYLQFLATAPHTLKPDSLQQQPKPLITEILDSSKTISDGRFEMKICYIGKQSTHTKDYVIYYFPSDKLIFENDLAWISKEGPLKKAGKRQAGLYDYIKDSGMDVTTVLQNWPTGDRYGVKSVFPFSELQHSVEMK